MSFVGVLWVLYIDILCFVEVKVFILFFKIFEINSKLNLIKVVIKFLFGFIVNYIDFDV